MTMTQAGHPYSGGSRKLLSVVVPIYNDESCVQPFLDKVLPVLDVIRSKFSYDHEVIFVMDPSSDQTEKMIMDAHEKNKAIKLIALSRRFGQQPSIMAGVLTCRGDACVVIDVDLQDPPEIMIAMMEKHVYDGFDAVYAVRKKRAKEPWIKRALTHWGYYVMNRISIVKIPRNAGDARLINRRIIEELRNLKETHAFFRGLIPFVGFRQTGVDFERQERQTGQTKYHLYFGSISNGINAFVCFSNKPLSLAGILCVLFFAVAIAISLFFLYLKIFGEIPVANGLWLLAIFVALTAGIQSLLMAIMGSYVGRIYDEVKQRPMFIIDKKIGFD